MKRFKIIGAVILAAVVAGLLLLPGPGNIEKYEDMYQRGFYEEVCSNLERELQRKPKWHEARELLVKAELKRNRLDSAVFHLLALEGEDIDVSSLVLLVDEWLLANKLSQTQAEKVLELLSRRLEAKNTGKEIVLLFLQLVAEYQDARHIPGALKLFMEAHVEFEHQMWSLVFQAWEKLSSAGDIDALWDTGIMLDNLTDSSIRNQYMLYWRLAIMNMASPAALDSLWEKHPEDALLAINHALLLEPATGLEFLLSWEQSYVVDDSAVPYYSRLKLALLNNVDRLDQADFAYLDPQELMECAFNCIDQPAKCKDILDWLEQHNYYPDMVPLVRAALKGPKPFLSLPGYVVSISPDGEKIIRVDASGIYLSNIRGGEAELISEDTFGGQAYQVLRWLSSNTLWVRRVNDLNRAVGSYLVYNIDTGEVMTPEEEQLVPDWAESLFPGPEGALAWTGKNKIWMLKGEQTFELSAPGYILGWIPDGSGLLLDIHGQISCWTGGEMEPTEAKGKFLGWRNNRVFYWTPESMELGVSKLMGCNLKTGEIIDYQLLGVWTAAAGQTTAAGKNYYQLLSSYAGYGSLEILSLIYCLP